MQRKGPGRTFGRKKCTKKERKNDTDTASLHRRNFRIVALPVILLFNLLRILAFQLWLLLSNAYDIAHALRAKAKRKERMTEPELEEVQVKMANNTHRRTHSAGPGEPALVKQKHHHRKAFEHISKALKIDEEAGG